MSVINHQHQMINRPAISHVYAPCASSGNPFWSPSSAITPTPSHCKPYPAMPYTRSEQLRIRIHENHLSYLSRDETPSKFELRTKIEVLITEYLSLIPHSHKFSFKEIGDCLSKSVKKLDFDPHKAIYAFEAIERYATNLLNFPWRHEFRTIFAFSGFFYRVVECVLVDFEPILELLGFNYDAPSHVFKLAEIPIDPDKVSKISLECLVAIVECKTMLNIYNLTKSKFADITWNDIHSIRADYICNTENAVKLIFDLKTTGKLIDLDLPDYSVKKFSKIDLLSPLNNINKSIAEDNSSVNLVPPPVNYLESNLDSIDFIDSANFDKKEPITSLASPITPCSHSLIALSSSANAPNNMSNHFPVERPRANLKESTVTYLAKNEPLIDAQPTLALTNSHRNNLTTNLPRDPKYSEIDSVLLAEINQFETHRKNMPSNNAPLKNFPASVSADRKLKVSINENKANERLGHVQIVNCFPKNAKPERQVENSSMAIASSPQFKVKTSNLSSAPALPHVELSGQNKPSPSQETGALTIWACKSCTYKNLISRDVCEMCHRSRTLGNEATPLVSGGRECNRCTLVNGKNEQFCRACNTSLEDSPTYI